MSTLGEQDKLRALVIGAGAVGVVAAYALFRNGGAEVSLVSRSDYDRVVSQGYTIDSVNYGNVTGWRPSHLYKSLTDAIAADVFYDYVVLTTKNVPDGPVQDTVAHILAPILDANKRVDPEKPFGLVLMQNGIDIEHTVLQDGDTADRKLALLSGVQMVASTKIEPGRISQKTPDRLYVGAFDIADELAIQFAKRFVSLYHNEGVNEALYDANVRETRWTKLLYNASINPTTALVGLDVSRCLSYGIQGKSTAEHIFRPAMKEIIAAAASEGIVLDEKLVPFFIDITGKIPFKPSMCVDAEHSRLMEIEVILGNPIRIAERHNVPVPTLSMLYHLLILVQGKLKAQQGIVNHV
ncbi:ADR079Cp [Eremothecium gossypii ATCC 10895]|uniref:ADR079Cp n=1 Tax=Eremothecium gossypii (strain ATCC 10895 / CBS 109.51 / FGSC 9923 / NRRL Y-1056) TaxID=284811 RepID=Q75A40_EREGS|nr:ADR079Cp [Eremothecium gossypii ATCC 10895]AAS51999.1 ADR079Cp [Eremothecium gossypii ATCC 10895]AEY96299.1 FADR079Cp [Eremothecium gossypii FDAG1]